MAINIEAATDDEIVNKLCLGESSEVTNNQGYQTRRIYGKFNPITKGLYDPAIFGVVGKCTCGSQTMPGRCPFCRELVVTADDMMNRYGYVKLVAPYVSDVKFQYFSSLLNKLFPDLSGHIKANPTSKSKDLIREIWCRKFSLIQAMNDDHATFTKDGVKYELDISLADENDDYDLCGLNAIYNIVSNYESLITGVIAKDLLKYVNKNLLIAPIPMRPMTIGYDKYPNYHKLSSNYACIIQINDEAKELIYGYDQKTGKYSYNSKAALIDKLAASYTIHNLVNHLFDTYAILRGSKESLFRFSNTMRVPQSGRANIITAEVPMDTVLLPRSLAYESVREELIERLKAEYYGTNIDAMDLYEHPNKEVNKIFEDLINNSVVVINRQPTLHKYGMIAFKAKLWENDDFNYVGDEDSVAVIGMNVLICEPFNADFDGDQMAYYIFTKSPDKENILYKMGVQNNWFYEKSGDPLFVPRDSILIGLHVGTKLVVPKDLSKVPVYSGDDPFQELEFDYNNQVISFDTPVYVDNELTTYGIEKISKSLHRPLKNVMAVNDNTEVVLSTKNITNISRYVGSLPDKVQVMQDLYEIGTKFATQNGTSVVKLNELYHMDPKFPRIKEILESDMPDKEKFIQLQNEHKKIIMEGTKQLMPTLYTEMTQSGAKIKPGSLVESFTPRIHYDKNTGKIDVVNESLVTGLSEEEYVNHAITTRTILRQKANQIPTAGYLTRQVVDLLRNYVYKPDLYSTDTTGIEVAKKDAVGRYTLDGEYIGENNSDELVRIKSSIYTDPYGPEKYYIKSDEMNTAIYSSKNNAAVGSSVASGTTENITQAQLGLKHGGSLWMPVGADENKYNRGLFVDKPYKVVELKEDHCILGDGINQYWYPVPKNHVYTQEALSNQLKSGDFVYYLDKLNYIDFNIHMTIATLGAVSGDERETPRDRKYISKYCFANNDGRIHYDLDKKLVFIGDKSLKYYEDETYRYPEGYQVKFGQKLCSGTISPRLINLMTNDYSKKWVVFYNQIKELLSNARLLSIELLFRGIFSRNKSTIQSAIISGDPMIAMAHQNARQTLKKIIGQDLDPSLALALVFRKNNRSEV